MNPEMLMVPAVLMGLKYLKLDYEDPHTVWNIRLLYGAVQVISILLHVIIYFRVISENNSKVIEVTEALSMTEKLEDAQRMQEAKEKGKIAQPALPKLVKMSIRQYDLSELKKGAGQVALGLGITCFLHLKFNFVQPLILQAILGPLRLKKAPLILMHIFGQPQKRPFPTPPSPFAALTGETNPTKKQLKRAAKKASSKVEIPGIRPHLLVEFPRVYHRIWQQCPTMCVRLCACRTSDHCLA
eukprot:g43954.t1